VKRATPRHKAVKRATPRHKAVKQATPRHKAVRQAIPRHKSCMTDLLTFGDIFCNTCNTFCHLKVHIPTMGIPQAICHNLAIPLFLIIQTIALFLRRTHTVTIAINIQSKSAIDRCFK